MKRKIYQYNKVTGKTELVEVIEDKTSTNTDMSKLGAPLSEHKRIADEYKDLTGQYDPGEPDTAR